MPKISARTAASTLTGAEIIGCIQGGADRRLTVTDIKDFTAPYKVYRALLTQTTTGAPVATILENTLGGTLVWSRSSAGSYIGTLSGAFTVNKTFILVPSRLVSATGSDYSEFTLTRSDANSVSLTSTFGPNGTATFTDSMLAAYPVEILVYN